MEKFEGLIAAPFAPMNMQGEIVPDYITDYFSFLESNRIRAVFINGSTGEGVSLSQKERMQITEAWSGVAKGSMLKVIVLVGGTSYTECIENALHAKEAGVDSIAMMAPYYYKPSCAEQLVEFCGLVAKAVPDLPVYFYHIPVLTGCTIQMIDFLIKADPYISNLKGIKYTHEDFMDFLSCIHFKDGKYDLLWGRDENLLSALPLGTRAAVGSTFNYAAPLYYELLACFDRGDLDGARLLQQQSINMISLLPKYGGISAGKAYMKYLGFDFGITRSPNGNLSPSQYKSFLADLENLNMQHLFSKKIDISYGIQRPGNSIPRRTA